MSPPILPAVAIVGRPNVGKSALFNRLAGRQISIVHDQPGITRDRLVAECRLERSHPFEIIDTGGIGSDADTGFTERVRTEAEIALASAAVVLFVVDGRAGLTPVDQELARLLRRADKPILLVVNKLDEPMHAPLEAEFARLGFRQVLGVSAAHGRGIAELVASVTALLPAPEPVADPDEDAENDDAADAHAKQKASSQPPFLALVGRPNVGKSSLTNAILGQTRTIVSDVSGTTRDAVDIPCEVGGKRYVLIDTAGIRHRRQTRQFRRDLQRDALGVQYQTRRPLRPGHRRLRRSHPAGPSDSRSDPARQQTLHGRGQQMGSARPTRRLHHRGPRVPRGLVG